MNDRFNMWIAKCKALRSSYSDAGVAFFEALLEFEADTVAWRYTWPTFSAALQASELCMPHRFDRFKMMVEVVGSIDDVRKIGMDAAERMLHVPANAMSSKYPTIQARKAIVNDLLNWADSNQVTPTGMTGASVSRVHYTPTIDPSTETAENAFEKLVRENKELRAKVRKLEAENARLLVECERLSGGEITGTTRKPTKQGKASKRGVSAET
jgi:hypothetical protein